jgi:hypothetical protein
MEFMSNLKKIGSAHLLDHFAPRGRGNAASDAALLALVRMGLGLVLAWRSFFIASDAAYYFEERQWLGIHLVWESAVGWLLFVLGLMLAAGIWTRVVAFLLMAGHAGFSIWTSTYNLGPMLMVPMFGGLAFLNAGAVWSIDAWRGGGGALPRWRDWQQVGLVLFTFYAVLHFSAVIFHLKDVNWVTGKTTALLFTNSYLSRYYEVFRLCEAAWPAGWKMASWLGGSLQTVFQLGMLPMVFFRWGRAFVIWYGGLFIAVSLVGILISILPMVEVLLWVWLFLPSAWLPKILVQSKQDWARDSRPLRGIGIFVWGYAVLISAFTLDVIFTQALDRPFPQWFRGSVFSYSGLIAPNVFNQDDLSMGDHWPVIHRVEGSQLVELPLNGTDGQRLVWHRSDLLYYANSLRWRRGAIRARDWECFMDPSAGFGAQLIQKLIRYDYRKIGAVEPVLYAVEIYANRAAAPDIGDMARYKPVKVYRNILKVDSN